MASQEEIYGPPNIPNTPSKTINNMLRERCGKQHTNVFKAAISYGICYIFQAITVVYQTVHKDKVHSHSMWMTACGTVGGAIVVAIILVYNAMMMSAFLMHNALYLGTWALCLFATGLCVSGMVFFDKDGGSSPPFTRAPSQSRMSGFKEN